MVIIVTGASHTGKTLLAQKLLEKYHYPYLSVDILKMGLIRSGNTNLTAEDDCELEEYLWPIVREMIRTAVENRQNLIVEGCYIPFRWQDDFTEEYLRNIEFICLVMSEEYIRKNLETIRDRASVIEDRIDDSSLSVESVISDNRRYLEGCRKHHLSYFLIDDNYPDFSDILPI